MVKANAHGGDDLDTIACGVEQGVVDLVVERAEDRLVALALHVFDQLGLSAGLLLVTKVVGDALWEKREGMQAGGQQGASVAGRRVPSQKLCSSCQLCSPPLSGRPGRAAGSCSK